MFYKSAFYVAFVVFFLGLSYKIYKWFTIEFGADYRRVSASERIKQSIKGILATLFSPKIFVLIKTLFYDVIFNARILKEDFTRWLMHITIFWGFILLLLMHGLDKYITLNLFPNYEPTLNPFLFLRNLLAGLVIFGVIIAIIRRIKQKRYWS